MEILSMLLGWINYECDFMKESLPETLSSAGFLLAKSSSNWRTHEPGIIRSLISPWQCSFISSLFPSSWLRCRLRRCCGNLRNWHFWRRVVYINCTACTCKSRQNAWIKGNLLIILRIWIDGSVRIDDCRRNCWRRSGVDSQKIIFLKPKRHRILASK